MPGGRLACLPIPFGYVAAPPLPDELGGGLGIEPGAEGLVGAAATAGLTRGAEAVGGEVAVGVWLGATNGFDGVSAPAVAGLPD
jgi:hypothetical protein